MNEPLIDDEFERLKERVNSETVLNIGQIQYDRKSLIATVERLYEESRLFASVDTTKRICALSLELEGVKKENARLHSLINSPEIENFIAGVKLEAAHQREKWGENHDMQKTPEDWFWTLGYLAGKALAAQKISDEEKLKHHLISSCALLCNYHKQIKNK